ncbi:ParA family protein [Tardiphaga sp. vice154]|uniref:ParA family protein n=1 Tax=Tardiphaga sp. vice154 TaxID=2592814 RepID=UPI001165662D|nr:ParA family protein [Tardiphaga sp. vice154]QDM22622.1 ParA family protein [Tardiphaga sp. vice154]
MSTIIAVAQRKGGVGKTTIAVCVAGELLRHVSDVGLIDADSQASACHWAAPGNLGFPVYELEAESRPVGEWVRMVRQIPHGVLVIDCAPNDRSLGAALAVANIAIVPCTPSGLDIEATLRTLDIVRRVRASRQDALKVLLVPNRVDRRTLEGQQVVDELSTLGEPVGPAIGSRSAFVRAFAAGQSVSDIARSSAADQEIRALTQEILAQVRAK